MKYHYMLILILGAWTVGITFGETETETEIRLLQRLVEVLERQNVNQVPDDFMQLEERKNAKKIKSSIRMALPARSWFTEDGVARGTKTTPRFVVIPNTPPEFATRSATTTTTTAATTTKAPSCYWWCSSNSWWR